MKGMTRRTFIAGTAVALAGCMGSSENGGGNGGNGGNGNGGGDSTGGNSKENGGEPQSFGGWFDNTGNYDGVEDKTGQDEVTVMVGTEGNGGNYAYDPPAIKVSAGTNVVWEWTGKGQTHNVVASDDTDVQLMDSGTLKSEQGYTFNNTFDSAGTYKYYCTPHKAMGMKGVVVVE